MSIFTKKAETKTETKHMNKGMVLSGIVVSTKMKDRSSSCKSFCKSTKIREIHENFQKIQSTRCR